jgi:hypothetical protein
MGFVPSAGQQVRGVIGLRMVYLARDPDVRAHVLNRLNAGQDLFQVASTINVRGQQINLFGDEKADFEKKLGELLGADAVKSYRTENNAIDSAHQDTTQSRDVFREYWTKASSNSSVASAIRAALIAALGSGGEIDFGWQADLATGAQPGAASSVAEGTTHVVFHTDQGPSP